MYFIFLFHFIHLFFDIRCSAGLLAQISSALSFLHSIKTVHRDMSPGNCFLFDGEGPKSPRVKIGDFGQSFMFKSDGRLPTRCGGTPGYFARLFKTLKFN